MQNDATKSDIKRQKATFSSKVLTISLSRPKFSLRKVANKGVAVVEGKQGGTPE